jgi:integrase
MGKLTEGSADELEVPAGSRDVQAFDDALPGFGIRKFAKGHASYFVKYNVGRQQRRKTLGRVVRGNLRAMRLEASAILAKARLGHDTVAIAKAAAAKTTVTLGAVIPRYLEARRGELRPKTYQEAERYLQRSWAPLHGMAIDEISRKDAVAVVDELERTGKVGADRARTALSALLAWGIDRGYLASNVTADIRPRAQNGARERVLNEPELVATWNACDGEDDFNRIVRLLLLTGQRRSEIGGLSWPEIDLDKRQLELPSERTKNGKPHIVCLSDEALTILSAVPRRPGRELLFGYSASGFAGWSKSKRALDARLPIMSPWRLHDLRRTFVTGANELGVAPHIVEHCINHTSGARGGVAGTYNKSELLPERRRAFDLWAAHIASLVSGKASKIVPLIRSQSIGIDAAE